MAAVESIRRFFRGVGFVFVLVVVSGCSSLAPELPVPGTPTPAPRVRWSPSTVLPIPTANLRMGRVAAIADSEGRVHLFAISLGRESFVRELVIGRDGVEDHRESAQRSRVRSWAWLDNAARDREGHVHAIFRGKCIESRDGMWQNEPGSPMRTVSQGSAPEFLQLAEASGGIVCAFRAGGRHVGAPTLVKVATMMAVIIPVFIPYPSHPGKLVIAQHVGDRWVARCVLDGDSTSDALDARIATDARGRVHVLSATDHGWATRVGYVRLDLDSLAGPSTDGPERGRSGRRRSLTHVSSSCTGDFATLKGRGPFMGIFAGYNGAMGSVSTPEVNAGIFDLAVDSETGTAMVGVIRPHRADRRGSAGEAVARIIRDGAPSPPVLLKDRAANILVAPDGNEGFHALVLSVRHGSDPGGRVLYFRFRGGAWSAPVELGAATQLNALTPSGMGRAVAIWTDIESKSLVSQWVEPAEEATGH